jgi:predicted nucleic acid-binding protein
MHTVTAVEGGERPTNLRDARKLQLVAEFLPDDVSFEAVSMRSLSGFKRWNDAYLIALCVKHQTDLATLERKLDNMDASEKPLLVLIP